MLGPWEADSVDFAKDQFSLVIRMHGANHFSLLPSGGENSTGKVNFCSVLRKMWIYVVLMEQTVRVEGIV